MVQAHRRFRRDFVHAGVEYASCNPRQCNTAAVATERCAVAESDTIMNMKRLAILGMAALATLTLNSCETATGTGALVGASTGALIGSSVGGHHHRGYYRHHGDAGNALAGAAIGAGAGALIGAAIDADRRGYYEGHEAGYYPYGMRTGRAGLLRSPYPPNALVDVRGIPRGALVRDPATGRPFRRP